LLHTEDVVDTHTTLFCSEFPRFICDLRDSIARSVRGAGCFAWLYAEAGQLTPEARTFAFNLDTILLDLGPRNTNLCEFLCQAIRCWLKQPALISTKAHDAANRLAASGQTTFDIECDRLTDDVIPVENLVLGDIAVEISSTACRAERQSIKRACE